MKFVKRKSNWPARTALTMVLAAGVALPTTAAAQTETPLPSFESEGLDEIIVTAQKKSESLQRTALAISAIGQETLETRGITDAANLSSIAPSLTTTASTGKSNVIMKIRGIGESDVQLTNDSPIGLYVDGVIISRASGGAFEIVDLERIEVLRGPQGTLHGRYTTGGAVNLITKKPSETFGAELATTSLS